MNRRTLSVRTWLAGLAAAVATLSSAGPGLAQLGDPAGPGVTVPRPPAMCASTIACTYGERNYLPNSYRVQRLEVCGANCTTQYWVSTLEDGRLLLTVEPTRGGGLLAVGRGAGTNEQYPPVRVVVPDYGPNDPACCPSGYKETTYTWDAASGTLVAGAPSVTPSASFGGWDAARRRLEADGFFETFLGG